MAKAQRCVNTHMQKDSRDMEFCGCDANVLDKVSMGLKGSRQVASAQTYCRQPAIMHGGHQETAAIITIPCCE